MMDSETPNTETSETSNEATEVVNPEDYMCAECIGEIHACKYRHHLEAFHAFTWAPNPKYYKSFDPNDQYYTLLACVLLKKNIINTFQVFLFTPELTESGNIHIHGYFSIKDSVKYFKWFLPLCKSFGYVMVKGKVDTKWTEEYVLKDMNKMEDILDFECPCPLTDENFEHFRDFKYHFNKLKFLRKVPKGILKYINKK